MDTKLQCLGLHTRKGMFKSGTLKQLNKCVMKLSVLSVSLIRNIGRVAQMSVSFSRSRRSADDPRQNRQNGQNQNHQNEMIRGKTVTEQKHKNKGRQ